MNFITRLSAAALAITLAAAPAFAQVTPGGATVGPAGGVASTTAPSNGQGTPAGGTGVLSTTRVGPSGVTSVAPVATTPPDSRRPRRARTARRRAPVEVGTQSQAGTNGSVAPATK